MTCVAPVFNRTVTGLDDRGSVPDRGRDLFATASTPTLSPAKPLVWTVSLEVKRLGREANHSRLVPRLTMRGVYLHSPILLRGVVHNQDKSVSMAHNGLKTRVKTTVETSCTSDIPQIMVSAQHSIGIMN